MTTLNLLIGTFQTLPPALWGVVVGSFFSLSGVILTNRASEKRMKSQFLHERELRNADRDLALRKEVYLSAAEAAQAGFIALGRFSNMEVAQGDLMAAYLDRAPAIAKLHVIGREDTAKAVVGVATELTISVLRLTAKRMPMTLQKQQLKVLDDQIVAFGKERDRWLESMKEYNLSGVIYRKRWGIVDRNLKFEQNRISEYIAERTVAASNLYPQQLELANECMAETYKLGQVLIPAIAAMRKDLGVPTDVGALNDMFHSSVERQKTAFKEFLEAARNLVMQPT